MNQPTRDTEQAHGRRAALVIALSAAFWIVAEFAGAKLGWSLRIRALLTMFAGAGFVWALWMVFNIWRARQDNQR
ncbi:DUF5337 domain-containing protein [Pseudohalocynthiibacter aestuariivivens]|uniref:DUF5337 domain-containing protein n=1 Tax=Roseovarius pelagicus TaxID=2980108 RepID=A0ABY6DEM8_9RHOB|nr:MULTISPECIES: DUF5337 family protein [Rhodobacterales]QIE44124.1 DUF5337 domain-containing protein [Pseudohalocynthiibacter aestuariivivens]UXX83970.1 DUF5337 domain-containing protein [Roseovarius pelagicus]